MHYERPLPSLTVISASAGSGKTHALTNEYLSLLLSDRVPNAGLRNILAITFTHNAANEMKRRVLETLKRIVLRDATAEELLAQLSLRTGIAPKELADLAPPKIEELFDSYGDLCVQTIDSFLVNIFRTMALEMGFSPGADVEIQSDQLIERAFEEFIRESDSDATQRALLVEVGELLREQQRNPSRYLWDPYKLILNQTTKLRTQLQSLAKPLRPDMRSSEAPKLRLEIQAHAQSMLKQLNDTGLSVNKFFYNDLNDLAVADIESVLERKTKEKFFNEGKSRNEREALERVQPAVEAQSRALYELLSQYALERSRSIYLPFLRALAALEDRVKSIARREGLLTLDEVSRALSASVRQSAVPEIYFKLGETLRHFLIDEFQDTSPLQWSILKPLLEETLSGTGSLLVVGDTKQSIYSFRGADWRIMRSVERGQEFSSVLPIVERLEQNFRSDGTLVKFVHELFTNRLPSVASADIVEAAALSALSAYEQSPLSERSAKGYVCVEFVQKNSEAPAERQRLLDILVACRTRNIPHSEIAVLAPRNKDVLAISSWLNEFNAAQSSDANRIPFIAHSGLDIRKRTVVRELIALLSFLDVPIDDLSFATFLLSGTFLNAQQGDEQGLSSSVIRSFILAARNGADRHVPLYRQFERQYPRAWERYFNRLFTRVGYLSVYDLATEAMKTFRVLETFREEEAALIRLLEAIAAAESDGVNVLKEFLAATADDSVDERWQIPAPESVNAVRIMTIHKSKGLGFGSVILLMYDDTPEVGSLLIDDGGESAEPLYVTKALRGKNADLESLYRHRLRLEQTDWLNTLYVALTRAQHELHFLLIRDEAKPKLLSTLLEELERGRRKRRPVRKAARRSHVEIQTAAALREYEIVATALPGRAETQRGEGIHALLARIEFLDSDTIEQIREAMAEMSESERGNLSSVELESALVPFLANSSVRPFFERKPNRLLLNEREFVNARGELFRCDRVVVDDDAVTVVDFKTGSDEKEVEYRQQVRAYVRMLSEIFAPKSVRGVLAYVDLKKLQEVDG